MDYLDKVYLWLGYIDLSRKEFEKYFELDYSVEGDFDNPNYKVCGFCQDIGQLWYDEDFIGYIKTDEAVSIMSLLEKAPIDEDEKSKIILIAEELKLGVVNAIYWYSGEIEEPSKDKLFNGLRYIGLFNLD